jgi:chorismate--pyruvate lyase
VCGSVPSWSGTAGSLRLLHRILLATDGTVTTILEAYAGEPITAERLDQSLQPARPHEAELLAVAAGSPVINRRVLLRGGHSGVTFLHGESLIVPERMDPVVMDRLESTDEPIGLLLRASRLETFREVVAVGEQRAGTYGSYFGSGENAMLLFRTYRVVFRGQPVVLITENVLAGAEETGGW